MKVRNMNIKPLIFAILSLNAVCANASLQYTTSCDKGVLYVTTYKTSNSWHTMQAVWGTVQGKTDFIHCEGAKYTLNGNKLTKDEVRNLVLNVVHLTESDQ